MYIVYKSIVFLFRGKGGCLDRLFLFLLANFYLQINFSCVVTVSYGDLVLMVRSFLFYFLSLDRCVFVGKQVCENTAFVGMCFSILSVVLGVWLMTVVVNSNI